MRAVFPILLLLASPALAQAPDPDPLLWPEPQRAFLQDGPGLLLSEEQRAAFLASDEAGRDRFIRDFLRDPIPGTPGNELQEGIERRRLLASQDHSLLQDARAQLLFLKGRPAASKVLDCGVIFKPLEIWTYPEEAELRDLILYRPAPDEPFRLWLPIDSKEALYTNEAALWFGDWEAMGRPASGSTAGSAPTPCWSTGPRGSTGSRGGRSSRPRAPGASSPGSSAGSVRGTGRPPSRGRRISPPGRGSPR